MTGSKLEIKPYKGYYGLPGWLYFQHLSESYERKADRKRNRCLKYHAQTYDKW